MPRFDYYTYYVCGCASKINIYDGEFGYYGDLHEWDIWEGCGEHKDLVFDKSTDAKAHECDRKISAVFKGKDGKHPRVSQGCLSPERYKKYRLDLRDSVTPSPWAPNPKNDDKYPY